MTQRNWLELARKLVDQYDMNFTVAAMSVALGDQALAFFGEGVIPTQTYPNPFPIAMSGSVLGGSVGTGLGYDPNGQITEIDGTPDESTSFVIPTADPTHARWDLLVITYQLIGDTPVPKPSDPITTIDLNLHDDFELFVREGVPGLFPSYPAKQAGDIILAGLQVPANATLGTQVAVDLSIREEASPYQTILPVFRDQQFSGPGSAFTLNFTPITSQSVLVWVDDVYVDPTKYTLVGTALNFNTPLVAGQGVDVWGIEASPASQNPLTIVQYPIGTGNGSTTTFSLPVVPATQNGLLLFVDGRQIDPSLWTLNQSGGSASVTFNTAPSLPKSISAAIFVNVAAISQGGSPALTNAVNEQAGLFNIFDKIVANVLYFKPLSQGANITLTDTGTAIEISGTGGGGGSYTRSTHGTFAMPIAINPSVGIVPTSDLDQTWWVIPTGPGAQLVTAAIQIAAGTTVGQRVILKGTSATNYLIFSDGSGNSQNGPINLTNNNAIIYEWDGTQWSEDARRA